jgi:hypothetical protein
MTNCVPQVLVTDPSDAVTFVASYVRVACV